eukprot:7396836-Karenia_brevis.AAC.1
MVTTTLEWVCDDILQAFCHALQKTFVVKHRAVLGPDSRDDKKISLLNRTISWVDGNISTQHLTWEADARHVQ